MKNMLMGIIQMPNCIPAHHWRPNAYLKTHLKYLTDAFIGS